MLILFGNVFFTGVVGGFISFVIDCGGEKTGNGASSSSIIEVIIFDPEGGI